MMLVSLLVKASLLLVLAAAVHVAIARRASAASRHLLWTLTLAALLLLPALSAFVPNWTLSIRVPLPPHATAAAATVADVQPASVNRATSTHTPRPTSTLAATPTLGVAPTFASPVAPARATAGTSSSAQIPWSAALAMLYAGGTLLLLVRLVLERMAIRRLARQAIDVCDPEWLALLAACARSVACDQPIRLLRSRDQTMPMTFGTRRPIILLPAIADTWSDDRRRAVLLLELAHVARFDCLTQLMAAVGCAFYWIHPGVWWVARRLRVERELACDDRVLVAGTMPRDYAGHLLEIAYSLGGGRAPALVVSMARPRQLEGRMLAVLDETRNRATPPLRSGLAAAAVAAALLLPLAGAEANVMSVAADEAMYPSPSSTPSSVAHQTDRPRADVVSRVLNTDTLRAHASASPANGAETQSQAQERLPGTWEIRPANEAGFVHLRITEVTKDGGNWSSGSNVAIDKLQGLTGKQLADTNGPVTFRVTRDAGVFTFEGVVHNGVGAGTFTFAPNAAFPGELAKRGLARPTPEEQYQLARADVGFDYLDELTKQGYQRPALADIVRAAQHGVGLDYLRDMGTLGYRVGQLDALIKMRDHGVTPNYVRALRDAGYGSLTPEQTTHARDHGISESYIKEMADLGHGKLPLDELINARDHGVSAEYIRGMRDAGHPLNDLKTIINARDHGVSVEYIREMSAAGYGKLSLDELIAARDHGISVNFVQGMKAQGYDALTLDELRRARDHGVTPDYAKGLKEQGYDKIKLEDLIDLRNHGVTPDRVRNANTRAGTHLPLDLIKSLADGGGLH